jgi:hypothetical protein
MRIWGKKIEWMDVHHFPPATYAAIVGHYPINGDHSMAVSQIDWVRSSRQLTQAPSGSQDAFQLGLPAE